MKIKPTTSTPSVEADLSAQTKAGRKRSALITDIDNTLYRAGHEDAVQAAWGLRAKASEASYPIIAVTGGDYEQLVRGRIESHELPVLDVLVTSVGTEIRYLLSDGTYQKDQVYDKKLKDTGYDRLSVVKKAQQLIAEEKANGAKVRFQDPAEEAKYLVRPDLTYLPYKVSLHFFAEDNGDQMAIRFKHQFSRLKIVVCEEINHNATLKPGEKRKKYCLDIMPATKADAVNYLIEKLKIEQGVVAGDSGNDIDMLLETPKSFIAVAVGGHKVELKQALEAHKVANRNHKPIFIDADDDRLAAQTLLLFDEYLSGGSLQL